MRTTARRLRLVLVGVVVMAAVAAGAVWYARGDGFTAEAGPTAPAAGSTTAPAAASSTAVSSDPRPDVPTDVPAPTPGQTVASDPTGAPAGGQVQVAVTFADWDSATHAVEVDGFVSGVVESGGTCVVTLTRGGADVTNQGIGSANATTTSCGSIYVQDQRLSSGTWQAVLSYRSPTASGSSSPVTVTVPA